MSLDDKCRLCGTESVGKNGRPRCPKEKLKIAIEKAFAIDVTSDGIHHPRYICAGCQRKLERWWKTKHHRNVTLNITLASYSPTDHVDSSTNVIPFTVNEAKAIGTECGFTTVGKQTGVLFLIIGENGFPEKCFKLKTNYTWEMSIYGHVVSESEPVLNYSPSNALNSKEDIHKLLIFLRDCVPCPGLGGFSDLCRAISPNGQAVFSRPDGTVEAKEECEHASWSGAATMIRHVGCKLFISPDSGRCSVCTQFRPSLCSKQKGLNADITTSHCCTRNDRLNSDQMKEKLTTLQKERRQLRKTVGCLREKIATELEKGAVDVSNSLNRSLLEVMKENEENAKQSFEAGSPLELLWEQQHKAAITPKKQMRWHPALIRWCIALHAKSPAAHRMIGRSKFLRLPHETTLRDYSSFTESRTGFNNDIIERIEKDHLSNAPDFKRNVCVLFDEMKVKSGLVFATESGQLVGFCDLGDVNNELAQLARQCDEHSDDTPPVATHIIAFMVRGLFSHMEETFAFFPCTGFSSHQLYWVVSEAVGRLESYGFRVRALVSDGASPNRRFYRLHDNGGGESPAFFTINPYDPTRRIYFICDPPHLIKTIRSNWENSGFQMYDSY